MTVKKDVCYYTTGYKKTEVTFLGQVEYPKTLV